MIDSKALSAEFEIRGHYINMFLLLNQLSGGIAGKRILEVGGILPEPLVIGKFGASLWVGIDPRVNRWYGGEKQPSLAMCPQKLEQNRVYAFLDYIENLPAHLYGTFDLVFSVSCFEHILNYPSAMRVMAAALKPGGMLFTQFCPWSGRRGMHICGDTTINGAEIKVRDSIPVHMEPYDHLRFRPVELYHILLQRGADEKEAREIVYATYYKDNLNRLYAEEYMKAFESIPGLVTTMEVYDVARISPQLQQELELKNYPYKLFGPDALRFVARKNK